MQISLSPLACITEGDACKKRAKSPSRVQALHALHAFLLMPRFLESQSKQICSLRLNMRSKPQAKSILTKSEYLKFVENGYAEAASLYVNGNIM